MSENSSFRRICVENTEVIPVRDGLGILRFSAFFRSKDKAAILPLWPQLECGQAHFKNRTFNAEKPPKRRFSEKGGPSDRIRPCGILLPNFSGTLFLLVYSGFRRFLICFTYSLTLLSPLFPSAPAPSVVIYVVKNASRPVSGELSPGPDGKRFAFQIVCIVTLRRVLCKWFLRRE